MVPRVHAEDHAYLLQNADKRIVFVIPYQDRYSLIGTTDAPTEDFEKPEISEEEIDYLLDARQHLSREAAHPRRRRLDVHRRAAALRRRRVGPVGDHPRLRVQARHRRARPAGAPVLSIFGGKLTTYRKLAEHALHELKPYFPAMRPAWTEGEALPGGDLPARGHRRLGRPRCSAATPGCRPNSCAASRAATARSRPRCWVRPRTLADLGEDFGNGLTAAEIDYLIREEWALTADDILWRRTKCGLGMPAADQARVAAYVATAAPRANTGVRSTKELQ